MTEQHDSPGARGSEIRRPSLRSPSWAPVAAPAIALLVGLLIGGVVVGVAHGDKGPSASPQPTTTASTGTATESPVKGPTKVVVPADCLAAVDTVDRLTKLAEQGAGAIRKLQTQELRDLLTKLEILDNRARQQAKACRAVKLDRSPTTEG